VKNTEDGLCKRQVWGEVLFFVFGKKRKSSYLIYRSYSSIVNLQYLLIVVMTFYELRHEGISSICNEKVWRIDVGLSRTESRAGKLGASEVLELSHGGNTVKVLSTDVKLRTWKA